MITKQKLNELVLEAVKSEGMDDDLKVENGNISGWDSISLLSILVTLDKILDGKASSIDELSTCKSTDEIFDILQKVGIAA